MGEQFKYNEAFSGLLDTYKNNVAGINHAKENVQLTDSQNIMLGNYAGMLDTMLGTVFSYKQMIAANVSGMETVISELVEMDDDLQNNF